MMATQNPSNGFGYHQPDSSMSSSNLPQEGRQSPPQPSSVPVSAAPQTLAPQPTDWQNYKPKMHSFVVNGTTFIVDANYAPLKPIGTGAYGIVCSAIDKNTNKKVAIKKITRAFDDLVDGKRIIRELKLLRHFRHENVVGLLDLIHPAQNYEFEDIYMVLDFMETDLHKIIYSKNVLTDEHFQYFVYQILKALKYIHSAKVIHRDLKPSNLLLNSNCDLKICDFGLARGVSDDDEYTEYVVTRWYRAPEVMCSCQEYDHKIDVWSVGCILAELLLRKPLFPGEDYIQQLKLMFELLGTPSEEDMQFITNKKAYQYILSLPKRPAIPLAQKFRNASPLALDLLSKMLVFNPEKRISVEEALTHPYLKTLHKPELEIDCKEVFDFDFERIRVTKPVLQAFAMEEILAMRPYIAFNKQFAGHLNNLAIFQSQLHATANSKTKINPMSLMYGYQQPQQQGQIVAPQQQQPVREQKEEQKPQPMSTSTSSQAIPMSTSTQRLPSSQSSEQLSQQQLALGYQQLQQQQLKQAPTQRQQ